MEVLHLFRWSTHTYTHTTCHRTTYSHTSCPHTTCHHTTYSHTQLTPTQLLHTQLSHTQLVHTQLTPTQLAHTQLVHTQLAHTQLVHTRLTHTQLDDICLHFAACQAWHLWRCSCLRGKRGTWRHRPPLCVAGVALLTLDWLWWRTWVLWSPRLFGGQAYSTWPHRRAFCVAGVALMALDSLWWRPWVLWSPRLFAWQAWHLATSTVTLRGRRGTWRHRRAFCVAGVALMALDWEWWRAWVLWSPRLFACQAWHLVTSTVAGVALGHIDVHSAWQAWHLVTSIWHWTGTGGALGHLVGQLFAWQA